MKLDVYNDLNLYIEKRYVPKLEYVRAAKCAYFKEEVEDSECSMAIKEIKDTFSEHLLNLIDTRNLIDPDVYKKAGIDRKHFSKIRTDKFYKPSKKTAIALAVALQLTLEETNELLEKAGYVLSQSSKFDLIIEFFILNKKYDIFEINEALYHYNEPLLKD